MLSVDFWKDKRVFLTGHTGFKGGWTARWLHLLGARVFGYSLDPITEPSMFVAAKVADVCERSTIADIRDTGRLEAEMADYNPDVVLHYAAQPIVRTSYQDPVETFSVNVMGTIHVMEAIRKLANTPICIIVTSDKCYENPNDGVPLAENAPMGGADPYSASKGACEITVSSWLRSFFSSKNSAIVATGRAGNVIGGGDWADMRLLPDAMKAFSSGRELEIRNPMATRPWQHVLEPISGYLLLVEQLANGSTCERHFNFGPYPDQIIPVSKVAEIAVKAWGKPAEVKISTSGQDWEEAVELVLDISLAEKQLGWTPRLTTKDAIEWTVEWWKAYLDAPEVICDVTDRQISAFSGIPT